MNKEIKVGIIGVIGLVFFYLGSNFLKGIDFFSPINRYYAVYENVDLSLIHISEPTRPY